jgi:hypothetical protein
MFYYLLFNSTFIKKADSKDKFTTTIIYGSILYLILHGLICYFFKKTEILVYFWLALIIDICALISKSDIGSLSDVTSTFNYNPFDNGVKKVNNKELDVIDEYIEKNSYDDNNSNNDKKVRFKKKNNIQEFDNSKPPNKISKSKDVKKVKKIKPISKSTKIENVRNFEEINNNLPEYDANDINNTLQELQDDFLNKKMEDEFSDPGSDLDLEQFENSVINS